MVKIQYNNFLPFYETFLVMGFLASNGHVIVLIKP